MKSLDQFVKRGDTLGRLKHMTRQLDALTRCVRRAVPADMTSHIRGCVIRGDTLVVFTNNALQASALRYQQLDILAAARTFPGIQPERVQFKILPPEPLPREASRHDISSDSRQLLRQAASTIHDEELAAALRRLADSDQDAD